MRLLIGSCALVMWGSAAFALPPREGGRGFVDGANHHLGDASFVARYGRAPSDEDAEKARMNAHLEYVRRLLGSRAATRAELEARRAELLGYLDEYIAKGTTPLNLDVPWRSPVFVDALGHVCAVGYLIERSEGRALVERIADAHRFDYLEDIDMPEVVAWVAGSGFTLEELASIQPGYERPVIETWERLDLAHGESRAGPYAKTIDEVTTRGEVKRRQMHGAWTRHDANGKVIGSGTFAGGRGHWTSLDGDGRELAEGDFIDSEATGTWRFYHPSGRLAAKGRMSRGQRIGKWTFYYDQDGEVPIARGRFARGGRVTGTWRHFGANGQLIGTTWQGATVDWGEVLRMRVTPRDGLGHEIAEGNFGGDYHRVDGYELDGVHVYAENGWQDETSWYDAGGHALVFAGEAAGWTIAGCGWEPEVTRAARRGDVEKVRRRLRGILSEEKVPGTGCVTEPRPVDARLAAALERIRAAEEGVHTPTPAFMNKYLSDETEDETDGEDVERRDDLAEVIAASMTWYVEWPHIDGAFARVFATLPLHFTQGSLPEGG